MNNNESKLLNKYPEGTITPPPSKSISHRALICAFLANGEKAVSRIKNLGSSEDISATMEAMKIIGSGEAGIIDASESGSTLRFLIPIVALDGKEWTFTGKGKLFQRPLDIYKDIIEGQGGMFELSDNKVTVKCKLSPGKFELPGNVSSQFVTGLLFALPLLEEESEILLTSALESESYVDLTISCLKSYGIRVIKITSDKGCENGRCVGFRIPGGQKYREIDYAVESDYSQAAFFLCAAALGADVKVAALNENSLQGDKYILNVLRDMGAEVSQKDGLFAVSSKASNSLNGITIDVSDIPDLVPPIAALACFAKGTTMLINAARLRIKESDRLEALASELSKLGADITAGENSLIINGKSRLNGGTVDSWNDHRIAMALAVASIGCDGDVILKRYEAVKKSYPNFWEDFCVTDIGTEK